MGRSSFAIVISALLHVLSAHGATAAKRNVLYIVFDDLRPDISAYGRDVHTPAMQRLADTGIVFERAYAQQSVCSPSRNSFSTGRRPNSTGVLNFINHFRQAKCLTQNEWRLKGTRMDGGFNASGAWAPSFTGGAAQCCTTCSSTFGCAGWTFEAEMPRLRGLACTLFSSVDGGVPCLVSPGSESAQACLSGARGSYEQWTPLPAHFRNNGYLTLGTGKLSHLHPHLNTSRCTPNT